MVHTPPVHTGSDLNVHAGPQDTAFILEHLSYRSPYSEQLLVEDLSLTISQGSHLLVVGNTGTGKTSLLRVLNRLWEAHSGESSSHRRQSVCPLQASQSPVFSSFSLSHSRRFRSDDHVLWAQRNRLPAPEALPDRWHTARTGAAAAASASFVMQGWGSRTDTDC